MRIVIVEDNTAELNFLRELLELEPDVKIVAEETTGEEALRTLKKLKPDAAFIDISIPGLSGIEIVKELDDVIFTVFITAYQEHAIDAFDLGSVDYILKPAVPERIEKSLNRIRRYMSHQENINKLPVKVKGEIITLDTSKIIFIEKLSMQKKVKIHTKDKEYVVPGELKKYEDKLREHGFTRSHKSYLINIKKIIKLIPWGDKSYLVKMMGTNREALISRKYAPFLKMKLNM